jgi:hypothetical protein
LGFSPKVCLPNSRPTLSSCRGRTLSPLQTSPIYKQSGLAADQKPTYQQ